jgi:hypothetical protein
MSELMNFFEIYNLGLGFLVTAIFFALALYVYVSYSLMTIARKTKTDNAWLAWIPVANLYLVTQIAKVPWWTLLIAIVASLLPLGQILVAVISAWWWWNISERMSRPGWLGILFVIPVANLIAIGILAYGSKPKHEAAKTVHVTTKAATKKAATKKKKTTKKTSTKKKK